MTPATDRDIPHIRAFLLDHAASSMFPLSNLARHGTNGGHPRAVSFWIRRSGAVVTDVLTVSDEGMVFPQCPTGPWDAARDVLCETGVKGFIGEAAQVAALYKVSGLHHPAGLDMVEPHYQLNLMKLIPPDLNGLRLIPLSQASLALVQGWRAAFCVEAMNFPKENAREKADGDVAVFMRDDTHRVLLHNDEPVAMTGFNAVLPQVVQVGGVYTPKALRGRGFARAAVALHLMQARADGVAQAVLSAATPTAAFAYEAIGFRQIGQFTMTVWSERQHLHG